MKKTKEYLISFWIIVIAIVVVAAISNLPAKTGTYQYQINNSDAQIYIPSDQPSSPDSNNYAQPSGAYAGDDVWQKDPNNTIASGTIAAELDNRAYQLLDCCDKNEKSFVITVDLENGTGTHAYTPSPYENATREFEKYWLTNSVTGDINNDGRNDIALIIIRNYAEGNGVEPFLIILINNGNGYTQMSETELEERSLINSIHIQNGQVILDMTVHGPNDGACCASVHKIFKYNLDQLIKLNDTHVGAGIGGY